MSFHIYTDEPLIRFSRFKSSIYNFLEKEKVTASNVGKSLIVIGTGSGKVLYFNSDMCELNELKKHHNDRVTQICIDKDETFIISGSLDGCVFIHTISTGNSIEINLKMPVTAISIDPSFSSQQRQLVVGTSTGCVKHITARSSSFKDRNLYIGTTAIREIAWQGRNIAFADGERCFFMDLDEDILIDISTSKSRERDSTPPCNLYWSGRLLFIGWEDTVEVIYFFNSSRDAIPVTGLPSVVIGENDEEHSQKSNISNDNSEKKSDVDCDPKGDINSVLGKLTHVFNVPDLEITSKIEKEAFEIIKRMFNDENKDGELTVGGNITTIQKVLLNIDFKSSYIPILISRFRMVSPKLVIKSIGVFEDNIIILAHPSIYKISMMLQRGIKKGDVRSPYEYQSPSEIGNNECQFPDVEDQGDLNPLPQVILCNIAGIELSSYRLDVKNWNACNNISMKIHSIYNTQINDTVLGKALETKRNLLKQKRDFTIIIYSVTDLIIGKKITIENHCMWLCKQKNYEEAKELVLEYHRPIYIEKMNGIQDPGSSKDYLPSSEPFNEVQSLGIRKEQGENTINSYFNVDEHNNLGGKTFNKQFTQILEKCAKGFLNNHEYWKAAQTLSLILPLEGSISERDRLWEQWIYTFISFNALQYLVEFMPGFVYNDTSGAVNIKKRKYGKNTTGKGKRKFLKLDPSKPILPTNNRISVEEAKPLQLSSGCMLAILASLLASSHYFFNKTLYALKRSKVLIKTQSFNMYYKSIIAAVVERHRKYPHDVNIQEILAMLYHLNGQKDLSLVYRVMSSDNQESIYTAYNIFKYIKKHNLYDDAVSISGELFSKFPEASTAFFKNCKKEDFDKIIYLILMNISYNSVNAPYQKYTDDTITKRIRGSINVKDFVLPFILFMVEVNKIDRVFINTALGRAENKVNLILSEQNTIKNETGGNNNAQNKDDNKTETGDDEKNNHNSSQTNETNSSERTTDKRRDMLNELGPSRRINIALKQTSILNTKIANAITKIISNVTGREVRQEVTELLIDNPSNMNEIIPNAIRRMSADHEYTLLCLVAQHDPSRLRSVLDSLTQVSDSVKKQVVKEYRRVEEYVYLLKKENQAQNNNNDDFTDAATYKNNLLLEALDVLLEKQSSDAIDDAVQFVWSVEDSGKEGKGKNGYNVMTSSGSINLWEYLASKCGGRESVSRLLQLAADGKIPLDSIRLVELIDQNLEIDNLSVLFKCILHNADKRQKLWRLCFALVQRDTVDLSTTLYNKSRGGVLIGDSTIGACAICGREIISENASNTIIQMDGSVVHEECAGGN